MATRLNDTPTVFGRDANLFRLVDRDKLREATRRKHRLTLRYRMFGGYVTFVGRVKHLCVGDMIDRPVVKAVEQEMHRRDIGDLWGTRLADEVVEVARASLVKRDGPHDARTPQEAARYAVASVIDAGDHEIERAEVRLNNIIAYAERHRW